MVATATRHCAIRCADFTATAWAYAGEHSGFAVVSADKPVEGWNLLHGVSLSSIQYRYGRGAHRKVNELWLQPARLHLRQQRRLQVQQCSPVVV